MTAADETSAFVRQGLVSYPAARDAIELFQARILDAIAGAFADTPLKNFRRIVDAVGQPTQPKAQISSSGSFRWVCAYVDGAKRGPDLTYLTLGICWNAPKVKDPVLLYGHFGVGNKIISLAPPGERDPRIVYAPLSANEIRALLVPTAELDPRADFGAVLDAVDAAIPAIPTLA